MNRPRSGHERRHAAGMQPSRHPQNSPVGTLGQVEVNRGKANSVGAHPQHGPEMFFGKVSSQRLQAMNLAYLHQTRTTRDASAAALDLAHPPAPKQRRQLVEIFSDAQGRITGSHDSRSELQDLFSGHGTEEERQRMIQSLRRGPVSTDATCDLSIQSSGAGDDGHV